jgi:hypothetical protein
MWQSIASVKGDRQRVQSLTPKRHKYKRILTVVFLQGFKHNKRNEM